jgi:hypothetical protein
LDDDEARVKIFSVIVRIAFIASALTLCAGLAGMLEVWAYSSSAQTSEYTQLHQMSRGGQTGSLFYLTGQQDLLYWMFDNIVAVGMVMFILSGLVIWALRKLNQGRQ